MAQLSKLLINLLFAFIIASLPPQILFSIHNSKAWCGVAFTIIIGIFASKKLK